MNEPPPERRPDPDRGWWRRIRAILTKPRGNSPVWDSVIRLTGILGLLAIWPTTIWPDVAAFVGFILVTIVVNGPLSPFFPATYEPILMALGRAYQPAFVAFIGILAILYIEVLNYHLYQAALLHPRLHTFRRRRLVRRIIVMFKRRPFFTVWLCSWSPLPYWSVRMLAPLAKYPIRPYLLATFLGRYPRLWFFAAMGGVIPVPTSWLIAAAAVLAAIGISVATYRRITRTTRVQRADATGTSTKPNAAARSA
jgi:uncharacterized membrane protein YdjX (TVP38/TMEM64 family)